MRLWSAMRDNFSPESSKRIIEHGDTPAAYTEWREYLPIIGERDRKNLLEELTYSEFSIKEPLGCARTRFKRMLLNPAEEILDCWMLSLANTPSEDFRDFHITWLRNLKQMGNPEHTRTFLDIYNKWKSKPVSINKPESVIIELTRSCNYSCGMCSSRTGGFREEFTMSLNEFGEYIKVLSGTAKLLRINGYGETTIMPDLDKYLVCLDEFKYAGQREIITNLSGKKEAYDALIKYGFFIFGSWDAHNKEIFEKLRLGSNFEQVTNNFNFLVNNLKNNPYKLNLIFTVQESNLDSIPIVTEMGIKNNVGLILFNMVNESDGSPWVDKSKSKILGLFNQAFKLSIGTNTTVRIPDHLGESMIVESFANLTSGTRCNRPWREIMVNYDGEITCCNMFNPYSYGMLRQPFLQLDTNTRFDRLWNGPNAEFFRRSINTSRPHPYCEGCYFLHPKKYLLQTEPIF